MGRAHEVRAASMAKTAATKSKLYARYGKEIFIAAKSGVADPSMNLTLARKIKEAKANQVPADVIKRAVERAKGGDSANYDECRYEGFGPNGSTIIIDCLTDNTNRSLTDVKSAFNKTHDCKLAGAGAVSFGYNRFGVFEFETDKTADELMELLLMAEVDLSDATVEDGYAEIYVNPSDFGKASEALEAELGEIKYEKNEISMVPNEWVTLTDENDIAAYNKLMTLLDDVDDVDKVYSNVIIEG